MTANELRYRLCCESLENLDHAAARIIIETAPIDVLIELHHQLTREGWLPEWDEYWPPPEPMALSMIEQTLEDREVN